MVFTALMCSSPKIITDAQTHNGEMCVSAELLQDMRSEARRKAFSQHIAEVEKTLEESQIGCCELTIVVDRGRCAG